MAGESLERQQVEALFHPNITAAKAAFNFCDTTGYRNFCALSAFSFTHPRLTLDDLMNHIKRISGRPDGFYSTSTYQIALRIASLHQEKINTEDSKDELNDELFRYFCRGKVKSFWVSVSRPKEGQHLFGTIPISENSYCVWDTASSDDLDRKWDIATTSQIVDRLKFYHTAYIPIKFYVFS